MAQDETPGEGRTASVTQSVTKSFGKIIPAARPDGR
jgi:hypothetical protein